MFNLAKKKYKTAAATVQVATGKLAYVLIEQLQFGFWLINDIVMMLLQINHPVHTWNFSMALTREGPQQIHAVFINILSICSGHDSKKNPKRVWAHGASFEGYGHFTDFSACGKVFTKKSNDEILTWNFAHI